MNTWTRKRCAKCRWFMLKNKGWVGDPIFCQNVFCDKFWENIYEEKAQQTFSSVGVIEK